MVLRYFPCRWRRFSLHLEVVVDGVDFVGGEGEGENGHGHGWNARLHDVVGFVRIFFSVASCVVFFTVTLDFICVLTGV